MMNLPDCSAGYNENGTIKSPQMRSANASESK